MKIAVDAMGGDRAPEEIVDGVVRAVADAGGDIDIVLAGKISEIESCFDRGGYSRDHIDMVEAPEVVGMSESPAAAFRKKKRSSIAVAIEKHRAGEADAIFSAGNTGATVAGSLLSLGRIPGISRPAIAITYPTEGGDLVLLDGGANSDCYPHHLLQFASMGAIYAEFFLGKENPRVGLLNIGEEKSKGNELTRETYTLLADSGLNFIGNVEGKDVFEGAADVVVTDGFVGNTVLKFTESLIFYIMRILKEAAGSSVLSKAGLLFMKPALKKLKSKLDYAEYGAMPLLGINGSVFIAHGGSSARAIRSGLLSISRYHGSGVNERIIRRMKGDPD
ncbi:MAG: phosphate acyltransferase PlsX [Candidatus Latescibacteria bacterium]|nr:phosphate acyltransferase PlsX [bacterium]MBD3424087.1 phosphate acyltransferase PlsX [Candidatus Latescibacterota bacterium]